MLFRSPFGPLECGPACERAASCGHEDDDGECLRSCNRLLAFLPTGAVSEFMACVSAEPCGDGELHLFETCRTGLGCAEAATPFASAACHSAGRCERRDDDWIEDCIQGRRWAEHSCTVSSSFADDVWGCFGEACDTNQADSWEWEGCIDNVVPPARCDGGVRCMDYSLSSVEVAAGGSGCSAQARGCSDRAGYELWCSDRGEGMVCHCVIGDPWLLEMSSRPCLAPVPAETPCSMEGLRACCGADFR